MSDFRTPGKRYRPLNVHTTIEAIGGLIERVADLEEGRLTDEQKACITELVKQVLKDQAEVARRRADPGIKR